MAFPDPHHDHRQCLGDLLGRADRLCVRRGARLTLKRRQVLAAVAEGHAAVGAYEIIERLSTEGPRPAPITVYRALEFLLAHGLVHRIESRSAFVACSHAHDGAPAALLICETCDMVAELDVPGPVAALETQAQAQGFRSQRMVIEMNGRCGHCAGLS